MAGVLWRPRMPPPQLVAQCCLWLSCNYHFHIVHHSHPSQGKPEQHKKWWPCDKLISNIVVCEADLETLMLSIRLFVSLLVCDNIENNNERITRVTKWPSDRLTERPNDGMTEWPPSDRVTKWPSDRVTEWLNDWVTGWQEASQTIDRMVYFVKYK